MSVLLRHGPRDLPRSWRIDPDGCIQITCPDCVGWIEIPAVRSEVYIGPGGNMSPALACAHCPWEQFVILEGWGNVRR